MKTLTPNHALYLRAAGRRGCNRRVSWPPSLGLGIIVRPVLPFLGIALFVASCKPNYKPQASPSTTSPPPVVAQMESNKLVGVWTNFSGLAHGYDVCSTTTVAPDGGYVFTAVSHSLRSGGILRFEQKGTVRIEDGIFIQTITNDTQRPGTVSDTNRARIVRFDQDELWLDWEQKPNVQYTPTNEFVWRRLRN